jgi:hypothetical protein
VPGLLARINAMPIPAETRTIPGPGTVVGFVVGGIVVTTVVGGGEIGIGVAMVVGTGDVVTGTVVVGTVVARVVAVVPPPPVDIESVGETDEVMSGFTLWRSICFWVLWLFPTAA